MTTPEPVSFTVHGVNSPDLADSAQALQRRTRLGRLKMLLVLLVCASPVVASYLTYYVVKPGARSNYGELILPTRSLPALRLKSLDDKPVLAKSLQGQWLMVVVGPSQCDAICEKRLFMQRQLREMLGRERERVDKLWLVTDGGALAPALLAALTAAPPTMVLRADPAELAAWLSPAPGHALQDHLYLVDPQGEWMLRLPPDAEPAKAKRDLERLLRAAAGWDKPGR